MPFPFHLCVYVCLHECQGSGACGGLWRPEEGVGSPGVGNTGDCELPNVGVRNKLRSAGRAARAPNCRASSSAPQIPFYNPHKDAVHAGSGSEGKKKGGFVPW